MARLYLPTSTLCVVCGDKRRNPSSLGVRWYTENGFVKTDFATSVFEMGYQGIVHGGVLSGLLDESLCWVAGVHCGSYFVTGTLTVSFRRSIPVGAVVTVVSEFDGFTGKYAECHGAIKCDERVSAEAFGRFFPVPPTEALSSDDYWIFQPGDLDIVTGEPK
jgi:acyl-coenzyme A thioesterase PaaI-like protein